MSARAIALGTLALALIPPPARGDDPPRKPAWDLDAVLEQLAHHPKDPYLQYVALMLGQRADREREVEERLGRLARPGRMEERAGRRTQADLFSTFTGALAVQESLQLDTMRGDRRGRPRGPDPKAADVIEAPKGKAKGEADPPKAIPMGKLAGPAVKSHPWEKMLGDKKPEVGPLAVCVPDDFWFAEFRSLAAVNEVTGLSELWGRHLFAQALGDAGSQLAVERIKGQLGLARLPPKVLETVQVDGVALAGSDLFLGEGSDVTVLVQGRGVAGLLAATLPALKLRAREEKGEHAGIAYGHYATADGALNVYVATPRPDLHVRGNSLPAFRRVLECVAGKGGNRLGESLEYRYVRTLLPYRAAEEDGYVYLSDPFIRRLVGPQLKITERRRVLVYNHLRMIGHACLMFRTEHGRAPKSLAELAEARCAPGIFGKDDLAHPDGGTYALSADGMSGVCSRWGRAEGLTPCIEHPVAEPTREEADEYKQFVTEYSQYWRTYFDPIAVRVQASGKQYRLETLILPLIDNSIYTAMAQVFGGPAVALDTLPTPRREIGGAWVHFHKKPVLDLLGPEGKATARKEPAAPPPKGAAELAHDLKLIGLAMHNYHDTFTHLPPAELRDNKPAKSGLSWRVALLPFIEEDNLYKQFKLDEPWDSENNKKLIARMPRIYQGLTKTLNDEGKTTVVVPVGKGTLFPPGGEKVTFAGVTDGLSNTVLAAFADDAHAVVWTKPDDRTIDWKEPLKGFRTGPDGWLVVMADGSVRRFAGPPDAGKAAALLTAAGGEVVELAPAEEVPDPPPPPRPVELWLTEHDRAELERLGFDLTKVRRFVRDGIGDQVGFHLHDASRLFDYETSGAFGGGSVPLGGGLGPAELFGLGALVQFATGPSSVSIPVKDAKVVDEFLDEMDRLLTRFRTAGPRDLDLLNATEFYKLPAAKGPPVRCLAFKAFGLVYRVYWARIGDGLYVVNRPFVLEDIREAQSVGKKPEARDVGHALVRLRPENWKEVLPGYNLGWAEKHRAGCHAQLSPIANVARGWNDRAVDPAVLDRVARVYGVRPACPDGGTYALSADGRRCSCSVHGDPTDPRQPAAPAPDSPTGKVIRTFAGLRATLTFHEDGLRAVVVVERKE